MVNVASGVCAARKEKEAIRLFLLSCPPFFFFFLQCVSSRIEIGGNLDLIGGGSGGIIL
jgi:hypothetical protein